MSDITHILGRLEQGDARAAEDLLPLVYNELRRVAANKMANEAPGHTLQPTALVHELYVRTGRGWAHADLTSMTGSPNAAAGSALSGYGWYTGGSKQVVFATADNHVHELFM